MCCKFADKIAAGTGVWALEMATASAKIVVSYADIAAASRHTASEIATQSGKIMKWTDLVTKRYIDDLTATIRGYFDPIEERMALHDTRVGLAADVETKAKAKTKEASRLAGNAIVQDLDNEETALVTLGGQHKLTAKDIANYTKDAKASYSSLGKDGKKHIDDVITELNRLAGIKDITTKYTLDVFMSAADRKLLQLVTKHAAGTGPTVGDPGTRATGGPVYAGMPYVVGETQPELFVPSTNGYIVPHIPSLATGTAGGGDTYQIALTMPVKTAPDPFATASELRRLANFGVLTVKKA